MCRCVLSGGARGPGRATLLKLLNALTEPPQPLPQVIVERADRSDVPDIDKKSAHTLSLHRSR